MRAMPKSLGERTYFSLGRQAEANWLMLIKLEVQILGEILQVRDSVFSKTWTTIYPGQVFSTRGVSFNYDELRGMGNGKHPVSVTASIAELNVGPLENGHQHSN